MDKKTALITGCAGYLGSHLAKSLKQKGWKVVGLGHKRHTLNPYIDIMHYADIRDQAALDWIFEKVKIDVVFHLASRIEAGISFEEPTEFWSVNCGGTTLLLNSMKKAGVENIVFSSTAAVYKTQNRPIKEIDDKFDNSPYGFSKLSAENAIRHSGLNFTIFRYFNLTGADPEGEFGEAHEPETHLIPRLLLNMDKIEVNGTDYDTPDGTCVRDYVHVSDVADAHSKAGEMLLDGSFTGVTMNLGTGKGTSILEVIKILEKITNKTITYKVNPRRDGDAASLIANISLAEEVLQYRPKHDMISMIETAYKWYKNDEKI
jgi:UDP-glucose-4-epimerase GalE